MASNFPCLSHRNISPWISRTILTFKHEPHYMKSVRIRSFSGAHFPTFGLNTERHGVETPNTDTFHAVTITNLFPKYK